MLKRKKYQTLIDYVEGTVPIKFIGSWASQSKRILQFDVDIKYDSKGRLVEFLEEVKERLKGLDIKYVILVGTEPSIDPSLPKVTRMLKEYFGAYNMLLTNGVKLTDMTDVDEVMFSLKALDEDIYRTYTGRSNRKVLENLKKIYDTGMKLQVETVLIPGLIDEYEVERIAHFIAGIDPEIPYRIDAYFKVPDCPWEDAGNEEVERAASLARKHLKHVSCLTLDMKRLGDKALRIV